MECGTVSSCLIPGPSVVRAGGQRPEVEELNKGDGGGF